MKKLACLIVPAALSLASCAAQMATPTDAESAAPPTMTVRLPSDFDQRMARWRDAPMANGAWTYRSDDSGSAATFVSDDGAPKFRIVCDAEASRVTLERLGITSSEDNSMIVRTESMTRELPVHTPDRTVLQTLAYVPADDSLIDAIAGSEIGFFIQLSVIPLRLPAGPEVSRVSAACR